MHKRSMSFLMNVAAASAQLVSNSHSGARPRRERHARETLLRPVGQRAASWPRRVSRSPGQRAARRRAPGLGDARASMTVPHFPKRDAAGMLLMA
jgi:hypothetical protein